MKDLMKDLMKEGYVATNELVATIRVALATRPVAGAFLFGPAGSGKSALPQAIARVLQTEVIFFQCFPGTREDDLLIKLIPDPDAPSGVRAIDGPVLEAAYMSQERKVFLVLDEWDKTRPSADSFLLDFLQSGRIRFNGKSCTAKLENLVVWITMNDERELSEPLLRRLPFIKFSHLSVSCVRKALEMTHAGHPYLDAALVLYERCLKAGMSKPATVQELRQLLDAITVLGDEADWDMLVRLCVTKTDENHALLKQAERVKIDGDENKEEDFILDPDAYYQDQDIKQQHEERKPSLPPLRQLKKLASVAEDAPEGHSGNVDFESCGGILSLDDDTYNAVVKVAINAGDVPAEEDKIGKKTARILADKIVLNDPLPLFKIREVANSLKTKQAEIVFVSTNISPSDIYGLQKNGWRVVRWTNNEIYAKSMGIDLRYTAEKTEIIVNFSGYCEEDVRNLFTIEREKYLLSLKEKVKEMLGNKQFKTHGGFYKAAGIPEEMWGSWHPHDKEFSDLCDGWKKFLEEIGLK